MGARQASAEDRDPLDLDALSLTRLFRSGVLTPSVHTERVLDRARERGADVGAFAHLAEDLSREQAQRADADLECTADAGPGPQRSLFVGVPFPLKDLVEIEGLPFEAGLPALRGTVSNRTDGVAQVALDAGTVTVGKTTTSEFGMSVFSESPTGAARTPWDTRRTAGGSSGGAGAAVSAGIVPIAHGNDAGGSVRVPAACCGVVGMVAGRGVISSGPHGLDGAGLARHGVLARTVADVAAGIDLLAHTRPGDVYAAAAPRALAGVESALQELQDREVRPLTVGVLTTPMVAETSVHPEALAAVERARAALETLGHRVVDAAVPMTPEDWLTFMPVWAVGAASIPLPWGPAGSAEARAGEEAAGIGALTRWLRDLGSKVSGLEYAAAVSRIQELTRRMAVQWEELDVVLTPTLAGPPVVASEIPEDPAENFAFQSRFTPWTSVWNMNGWAAMSVPLHQAEVEGVELPFGVHLAGTRPGAEGMLLGLAAQLEIMDPWPAGSRVPPSDGRGV